MIKNSQKRDQWFFGSAISRPNSSFCTRGQNSPSGANGPARYPHVKGHILREMWPKFGLLALFLGDFQILSSQMTYTPMSYALFLGDFPISLQMYLPPCNVPYFWEIFKFCHKWPYPHVLCLIFGRFSNFVTKVPTPM